MIWRLRLAIARLLLMDVPAGVELYFRRNRVYTRSQHESADSRAARVAMADRITRTVRAEIANLGEAEQWSEVLEEAQ